MEGFLTVHKDIYGAESCTEHWPPNFSGFADVCQWEKVFKVTVQGRVSAEASPMHPVWVRRIRNLCHVYGADFVFHGWGRYAPMPTDIQLPSQEIWVNADTAEVKRHVTILQVQEFGRREWVEQRPIWTRMFDYGLGNCAGRELDGEICNDLEAAA